MCRICSLAVRYQGAKKADLSIFAQKNQTSFSLREKGVRRDGEEKISLSSPLPFDPKIAR